VKKRTWKLLPSRKRKKEEKKGPLHPGEFDEVFYFPGERVVKNLQGGEGRGAFPKTPLFIKRE